MTGNALRTLLHLWFSFDAPVRRRDYLLSGVSLAAVKYAGDSALIYALAGRLWTPMDYLAPTSVLGATKIDIGGSFFLLPLLVVWSLPFLWVGVSMSMRRAVDAKWSAWTGIFFFVPLLNYVMMLLLSVLPTDHGITTVGESTSPVETRLPRVLDATLFGAVIAAAMLGFSVYAVDSYGGALFLGTPFAMGVVCAYRFNRVAFASVADTMKVVVFCFVVVAGVLLLTAAEGAVCLVMASPLALGIGALGGMMGRDLATRAPLKARQAFIGALLFPLSASVEAGFAPDALTLPLREVRSSVVIQAPPHVVWEHVIAFPEIPEPSAWVKRSGIAYPIRAEIRGRGVGAVRYCVFSTGPFVEPITAWDEGRRLAFGVDSQPAPMAEWNPYANINPPHLDGWLISRRGEFRLVALPGNRTRLEGSTWYQMRLAPAPYWAIFGDGIIHAIHDRVLTHIKHNAEAVQ